MRSRLTSRLPRWAHPLMAVEAFVLFNLAFLSVDIYAAHMAVERKAGWCRTMRFDPGLACIQRRWHSVNGAAGRLPHGRGSLVEPAQIGQTIWPRRWMSSSFSR
jgi:hypothetical protein